MSTPFELEKLVALMRQLYKKPDIRRIMLTHDQINQIESSNPPLSWVPRNPAGNFLGIPVEINPHADEHTVYVKYKGSDDWVSLTAFDMKGDK